MTQDRTDTFKIHKFSSNSCEMTSRWSSISIVGLFNKFIKMESLTGKPLEKLVIYVQGMLGQSIRSIHNSTHFPPKFQALYRIKSWRWAGPYRPPCPAVELSLYGPIGSTKGEIYRYVHWMLQQHGASQQNSHQRYGMQGPCHKSLPGRETMFKKDFFLPCAGITSQPCENLM